LTEAQIQLRGAIK